MGPAGHKQGEGEVWVNTYRVSRRTGGPSGSGRWSCRSTERGRGIEGLFDCLRGPGRNVVINVNSFELAINVVRFGGG